MHVGGAAQGTGPVVGDQLQPLLVEALRVAQPSLGDADVGHRDGTPENVGDVAGAPHPGNGLGVLGERSVEVALGPGREPEQRVGGGPAHLVVVRREHEHALRMVDRAGDVAAHQRERGAVHLDRARQGRELRLVDDDHARGVAGRGRQRQPLLDVAQVFVDAIQRAGRHQRAHEADGEYRPDAHHVVGDELHPGVHRRVLPAAAQVRQRQLGDVGGPVDVAGRQRVPDRAGRVVVPGEPAGGSAMQLGRGIRVFVEEPRAQHVGEEVVVPVPLASIVERNHEQVLPIQRLERRLAARCHP